MPYIVLVFIFLVANAAAAERSDLADFQHRIDDMLSVRAQAYQFAQDNGFLGTSEVKLTRSQTNQMHRIGENYLKSRGALLPIAKHSAHYFSSGSSTLLRTDVPTGTIIHPIVPKSQGTAEPAILAINPLDDAGSKQLQDILRGLAAGLVLMDSYQVAVAPYFDNASIRYVMTYDVEGQETLRTLSNNYHSNELRSQLLNATRFADSYMRWANLQQNIVTQEEEYLYALIQSTLWYAEAHDHKGLGLGEALEYWGSALQLRTHRLQRVLSYGVSQGFGNVVGLVQTRSGYLAKMSEKEEHQLAQELKPLDILLEKTPFRLTDKMIPGHYGHVAVWLGSEAELRELGVWDQITPGYQEQIRKGGRIVEALRSGVTISSLRHFINIDDLLVLRDNRKLGDDYHRQAVLTALEQVGKEYDFNFDVLTHSRIVCSELAYVVFPDVLWPLDHLLGRYTISPDNVAQLAITPSPVFSPKVMYHEGERVNKAMDETLLALLAKKKTKPTQTTAGEKLSLLK